MPYRPAYLVIVLAFALLAFAVAAAVAAAFTGRVGDIVIAALLGLLAVTVLGRAYRRLNRDC